MGTLPALAGLLPIGRAAIRSFVAAVLGVSLLAADRVALRRVLGDGSVWEGDDTKRSRRPALE